MAVPSSGQLRLRADIALEVDGNATGTNVSLRALSSSAGFSQQDAMSEFYGYSAITSVPPTLTTDGYGTSNVAFNMNGTVTDDGGAPITERGFYFGTSTNRASNTKYSVGGTIGGFYYTATGLSASTTYYYWAYATNASGTTYGSMGSATTYPTLSYSTTVYGQSFSPYSWVYNAYGKQWSEQHDEVFSHPYLGNITLTTASYSNGVAAGNSGYSLPGKIGYIDQAGYNCKNTRTIDMFCDASIFHYDSGYNAIMGMYHDSPAQMSYHSKVTSASWYYWSEYGGTGNTSVTYSTDNNADIGLKNTYVNFNGAQQYLIQYTES